MDKEPPIKNFWVNQDILKSAPAIILGVSSSFFILGLLIVNLYLSHFGLYSKEFLRTEYVLAGAVFVLFLVMAEVGFSHTLDWIDKVTALWKEKQFIRILLSPYMLLPLLAVPLLLLLIGSHSTISAKNIKSLIAPASSVFFASMMFYNAYRHVKSNMHVIFPEQSNNGSTTALHKRISKLFLPLLLVISGLTFYAKSTYPYISSVYGGGGRAPVLIYPTLRGQEVCKILSLPINPNQSVGPLEILTESEKELTILLHNGLSEKKVAIQLNKDLLEAIQTRTDDPFNY